MSMFNGMAYCAMCQIAQHTYCKYICGMDSILLELLLQLMWNVMSIDNQQDKDQAMTPLLSLICQ